jgi:hypothetical protein
MFSIAALFTFWTKITDGLKWLVENWKAALITAGILYILFCIFTHYDGGDSRPAPTSGLDTISTRVDTFYAEVDSAAIFALLWKDSLPIITKRIKDAIYIPPSLVFESATDETDSLLLCYEALSISSGIIEECDSALRDATALRAYADTMRNDSVEVYVAFEVAGRLTKLPDVRYRDFRGTQIVRETITLKEPTPNPRKLYFSVAAGPRLQWDGNRLDEIEGTAGLGYVGRKNFGGGLEADFTRKDWALRARFVWFLNVSK